MRLSPLQRLLIRRKGERALRVARRFFPLPGASWSQQRALQKRLAEKRRMLRHYCPGSRPTCACCGEHHIEFLSLDGPGMTQIDWRQMRRETTLQAVWRRGLPDGMQVMCVNCRVGRYLNWGICPHVSKEGQKALRKEHAAMTCSTGQLLPPSPEEPEG